MVRYLLPVIFGSAESIDPPVVCSSVHFTGNSAWFRALTDAALDPSTPWDSLPNATTLAGTISGVSSLTTALNAVNPSTLSTDCGAIAYQYFQGVYEAQENNEFCSDPVDWFLDYDCQDGLRPFIEDFNDNSGVGIDFTTGDPPAYSTLEEYRAYEDKYRPYQGMVEVSADGEDFEYYFNTLDPDQKDALDDHPSRQCFVRFFETTDNHSACVNDAFSSGCLNVIQDHLAQFRFCSGFNRLNSQEPIQCSQDVITILQNMRALYPAIVDCINSVPKQYDGTLDFGSTSSCIYTTIGFFRQEISPFPCLPCNANFALTVLQLSENRPEACLDLYSEECIDFLTGDGKPLTERATCAGYHLDTNPTRRARGTDSRVQASNGAIDCGLMVFDDQYSGEVTDDSSIVEAVSDCVADLYEFVPQSSRVCYNRLAFLVAKLARFGGPGPDIQLGTNGIPTITPNTIGDCDLSLCYDSQTCTTAEISACKGTVHDLCWDSNSEKCIEGIKELLNFHYPSYEADIEAEFAACAAFPFDHHQSVYAPDSETYASVKASGVLTEGVACVYTSRSVSEAVFCFDHAVDEAELESYPHKPCAEWYIISVYRAKESGECAVFDSAECQADLARDTWAYAVCSGVTNYSTL